MLKSRNQVTLFVYYSYNSYYDLLKKYVEILGFLILYGGHRSLKSSAVRLWRE